MYRTEKKLTSGKAIELLLNYYQLPVFAKLPDRNYRDVSRYGWKFFSLTYISELFIPH